MSKELNMDLVKMVQEEYNKSKKERLVKRYKRHQKQEEHRIVSLCAISVILAFLIYLMFTITQIQDECHNEIKHQSSTLHYDNSQVVETIYESLANESIYIEPRYTDNIEYFAKCVMSEAGNQDEMGKRLVIDVILNRCDKYNMNTTDVINAPGQFEVVSSGRINNMTVDSNICELILQEILNRTNSDVLYFRTGNYHSFGTQGFKHQDHYFNY